MSKNESLVDSAALPGLAKSFESHGTDLESYRRDFHSKTDSEVIHDGFGVPTESEEVTSAYIEMSTDMVETLNSLRQHLDLDAAMKKSLPQLPEAAKSLDEAADAIEDINHEIHEIYLEIGVSIGISVGMSFLTMGFSAAAGAAEPPNSPPAPRNSPRPSAPSCARSARRSKSSPGWRKNTTS
ncbi:hypothetical protein [Streptomyces sp. NPDC039016]|uniref:hypothetical protein n=1 Tax=Streptomyces sp. NPDC039016 TaxID=3154330 RepID=UPI0033E418C4